jgi:hypothetical protein
MDRETRVAAIRELGTLEPVSEEWETWEEFEQGHPDNPNTVLLGTLGWREEQGIDPQEFNEGERARGRDVGMHRSALESELARDRVRRYGYQPFGPTRSKSWKLGWLEEDAAQALQLERALTKGANGDGKQKSKS